MDYIQAYLPQAYYLYNTYYTPYSTYLSPVFSNLLLAQSYFYRYAYPIIYPVYKLSNNALQSISSDSPDLLTLAVLAILLMLSLKVLDYMRKTIVYWISMAIRLAMWAALVALGFYVWQRGVEQSVEDFGWLWGLLAGLGEEGERVGDARGRARAREARRMAGAGKRGRTRGAGW